MSRTTELPTGAGFEDPHARHGEVYNRYKQDLFEFAMDHKDDPTFAADFFGQVEDIQDTFHCFLQSSAENRTSIRMFTHVADYRNHFMKMMVDIFGPAYTDFISPTMVERLWVDAQNKLTRDYGAQG